MLKNKLTSSNSISKEKNDDENIKEFLERNKEILSKDNVYIEIQTGNNFELFHGKYNFCKNLGIDIYRNYISHEIKSNYLF